MQLRASPPGRAFGLQIFPNMDGGVGGKSNKQKRGIGAAFRTLNDITNDSPSGDDDDGGGSGQFRIQHIEELPESDKAAAILRRIRKEFATLIDKRGWSVTSVTEMCCCGDGLDCLKKRKTKVMPDNVLGYNQSRRYSRSRRMVHDIHLRLRHPRSHALFSYEDVAGTMIHELAHCVRGPHDDKFYKAMEEIEEQYAVFMTKGVVVDRDGFPIGSNEAYVLGGSENSKSSEASRRKVLDAAEKRRKNQGHRLGGEFAIQRIPKNPREAARLAAERRLRDDQKCICTEVIEILDDEESDDEIEVIEVTSKPSSPLRRRTRPRRGEDNDSELDAKPKAKADESSDVIDLTRTDSPIISREKMTSGSKRMANRNWSCPHCTLSNPALALTCGACCSERSTGKSTSERVYEIRRQDKVDEIKQAEVRRSKEMFGGFDIYGSKKRPTSTLNHLT